jgi:hypothetical protein
MTEKTMRNRNFVEEWAERSKVLELVRRREIRETNTQEAIISLSGMSQWANERLEMRQESGLVYFYQKLKHGRTL